MIPTIISPQTQLLSYQLESNGAPDLTISSALNEFESKQYLDISDLSSLTSQAESLLETTGIPEHSKILEVWTIATGLVTNDSSSPLSSIEFKLLIYPDFIFKSLFNSTRLNRTFSRDDPTEIIFIQPDLGSKYHRRNILGSVLSVRLFSINSFNATLRVVGILNFHFDHPDEFSQELDETAFNFLPIDIGQPPGNLALTSDTPFYMAMPLSKFIELSILQDFSNSSLNPKFHISIWFPKHDLLFNQQFGSKLEDFSRAVQNEELTGINASMSLSASRIDLCIKGSLGLNFLVIRMIGYIFALPIIITGFFLYLYFQNKVKSSIKRQNFLFFMKGIKKTEMNLLTSLGTAFIIVSSQLVSLSLMLVIFPFFWELMLQPLIVDAKTIQHLRSSSTLVYFFTIYFKELIIGVLLVVLLSLIGLFGTNGKDHLIQYQEVKKSDPYLRLKKISWYIFIVSSLLLLILILSSKLGFMSKTFSDFFRLLTLPAILTGFFSLNESISYIQRKIGQITENLNKPSLLLSIHFASRFAARKVGNLYSISKIIIILFVCFSFFTMISSSFLNYYKTTGLYASGASLFVNDESMLSNSNLTKNLATSLDISGSSKISVIKATVSTDNEFWFLIGLNHSLYDTLNNKDLDLYPRKYNDIFKMFDRFPESSIILSTSAAKTNNLVLGDVFTLSYRLQSNWTEFFYHNFTVIGIVDSWPGLGSSYNSVSDNFGIVTISAMRGLINSILQTEVNNLRAGYYFCFSRIPNLEQVNQIEDELYNKYFLKAESYWNYLDASNVLPLAHMLRLSNGLILVQIYIFGILISGYLTRSWIKHIQIDYLMGEENSRVIKECISFTFLFFIVLMIFSSWISYLIFVLFWYVLNSVLSFFSANSGFQLDFPIHDILFISFPVWIDLIINLTVILTLNMVYIILMQRNLNSDEIFSQIRKEEW